MNSKPILIVPGEPNSIFLEIFFKSIKHKYSSPLIMIVSKKLLTKQMKHLNFNYKINLINKDYKDFNRLNNKNIPSIHNCIKAKYIYDLLMKYINGLINLLTSLITSTIIIYAINIVAGFAGADYAFTNGEVFVIWILMAILVNNCFKK